MKKGRILIASLVMLALVLAMAAPAGAWDKNTAAAIVASATQVSSGESVDLTITESNTGGEDLTDPYVDLFEDGALIMTLDASTAAGDGGDPGVLDVGETWTWTTSVTVTDTTTFVVIGHGFYGSYDVTYPYYPTERAEVTVEVTDGGEGFTPGYWKAKKHRDDWIPTGYSPTQTFSSVFGVGPDVGLLDALSAKTKDYGAAANLMRHAVAAALNIGHPNLDYPLTESELIAAVQAAWSSPAAMDDLKNELDGYNNKGGDI